MTANDIHRRLNPDSRVQHYMSFADMFSEVSSKGLNCEDFCQQFMNSQYAQDLEKISLKSQLPSGATMLNDFLSNSMVSQGGQSIGIEAIRWIGYMYAYWHIATGESYKEIYAQANLERMVTNYLGMHCLQEDAVIANLKQIYKDSKSSGGTLSELTQLSSKEEINET